MTTRTTTLRAATARAALALWAAALAAQAISVCAVCKGSYEDIFGKGQTSSRGNAAWANIDRLTPKERFDFAESAPDKPHPDHLMGFATANADAFSVVVASRGGGRAKSIDDIGGAITFQMRPSMRNSPADRPPVFFRYNCAYQPKPPPREYGDGYGAEFAESIRNPPSRIHRVTPAYFCRAVPSVTPSVTFLSLPDGWALVFTFAWSLFFDSLPYAADTLPQSWRLVVERTRPDGTTTSWGTLADPVAISWPRGGNKLVDDIHRRALYADFFGRAYKHLSFAQDFWWGGYRTEKYIGFFDPGVVTFEPKNTASDEAFYTKCLAPLLKHNANLGEALFFDIKDGPAQPPAAAMTKVTFEEIFSQLHRVRHAGEDFDALRRDYLLARFLDEPLPSAVPPEDKTKKAAPPPKRNDKNAPALEDEEAAGGPALIELDDISF